MRARKKEKSALSHVSAVVPQVDDLHGRNAGQEWRDAIVTDAELEAWEKSAAVQEERGERVRRLIWEVRQLQEALRGVD